MIYHKYEDHYYNHIEITTDAEGNVTYTQDISKPHVVFFQIKPSTYYLTEDGWLDNYPVGSDPNIGTWDPIRRIARLTTDIVQNIEIVTDNLTLYGIRPGNAKSTIESAPGDGIFIYDRQNITVTNLNIQNCGGNGIHIENSINIIIKGNRFSNNEEGEEIDLYGNRNVKIEGNEILSENIGIDIESGNKNIIIESNTISNGEYGVYLNENNNSNKIVRNTIINTSTSNKYFCGIYFEEQYNNYNTIEFNSITISEIKASGSDISYLGISRNKLYGIYFTSGNNENRIEKNVVSNNGLDGIYFDIDNRENILVGNTISNNQMNGVYLNHSNYRNIVEKNFVSTNQKYGIYLGFYENHIYNYKNRIVNNRIVANKIYGIYIDKDNIGNIITNNIGNIISNNMIYNNTKGMYLDADSHNNHIRYNNFINSISNNAFDGDSNDFYSNYWSDWDGHTIPYLVTGAKDPKPSRNVNRVI